MRLGFSWLVAPKSSALPAHQGEGSPNYKGGRTTLADPTPGFSELHSSLSTQSHSLLLLSAENSKLRQYVTLLSPNPPTHHLSALLSDV